MRSIAIAAALMIAGFAGAASAQRMSPNGVVYGQSWNLPQNLSTLQGTTTTQGSGSAADRAARAARQAQFNQHFPGTPIRRTAAR